MGRVLEHLRDRAAAIRKGVVLMDSHDTHAELVGRLRSRCHWLEDQVADLRQQLEEREQA